MNDTGETIDVGVGFVSCRRQFRHVGERPRRGAAIVKVSLGRCDIRLYHIFWTESWLRLSMSFFFAIAGSSGAEHRLAWGDKDQSYLSISPPHTSL